MEIVQLIEIALANTQSRRVEVAALEPADVATEAVSGLAQIVSELVDNAIAFSEPDDKVRVTGLFDQENYLISISDRGIGLPDHLIAELNRLLDDPYAKSGIPRLGIALVARLAARNGIAVKLVPGVPGTTARVTMPGRLAAAPADESDRAPGDHRLPPTQPAEQPAEETDRVFAPPVPVESQLEPTGLERVGRTGSGVVAMSEEARREAEAFLEKVFGPLVEGAGVTRRQEPTVDHISAEPDTGRLVADVRENGGTVTSLRTRIPGENFSIMEDDPSTIAAERAIDIRTALSRFEQGRRAAKEREES